MIFILILINLLWASTFIFGKILLEVFPVSVLISVRFLTSGVLIGLIFRKRIALTGSVILKGSVIGVINGLAMILQVVGLQYTSASNSGFLTATYILFLPFIEWAFWKKKLTGKVMTSVGLSFFGVFLLSVSDLSTMSFNIGDLYTLGCGFTFAFQVFFISHYTKQENLFPLIFVQFLASGIMGLGYMAYEKFVFGTPLNIEALSNTTLLLYIIFLAVFATFVPFSLQFYVQKKIDPSIAGLSFMLEPVFTVILAVIFLSEPFGPRIGAGILLILSGIALINYKKKVI